MALQEAQVPVLVHVDPLGLRVVLPRQRARHKVLPHPGQVFVLGLAPQAQEELS